MSRTLSFYYDILLTFGEPVRSHAFVLRCVPPSFPGQEVLTVSLALDPAVSVAFQHDGFGNLLEAGRVEGHHDRFRYTVQGTARLDLSRRVREAPHPVFRYPSPFTGTDEAMEDWLRQLTLPPDPRERAWALAAAVGGRMTYLPGVTSVRTTAAEAFAAGQGVCQDFAHIYLALARRAGLTARYVNGLPEGEGASHAWCEVWLDGVWTGIDPTRGRWTGEDYLRFSVGRDFGDCPMERGVFLGLTTQSQTVFMRVRPQ
ncbi:transglutaminase family protein [Dysosmobacter sp.]|uniref:transglutaminase family protein n=1 Tax=Dysosmobacter sp. TaxID=2591382 RepID=UPI002A8A6312|nr:transglutaminase family protein [Dysosmobacter sp.]MDY3280775.1 transglutaminase family protein [Dysosmobacter sp.]